MTRVKICGITRTEDALKAAKHGAWAVGFIFHKKSPRYIGPYKVKKIVDALPPFVTPVGVFVNQKEGAVKDIAGFCGLRALQFHGDEPPSYLKRFSRYKVIKALRVGKGFDPMTAKAYSHADALLFDTYREDRYGGSGQVFDWTLIRRAKDFQCPLILSGGLNADNIAEAAEAVRPYCLDVSSGVETSPGIKSERAIQELFARLETI